MELAPLTWLVCTAPPLPVALEDAVPVLRGSRARRRQPRRMSVSSVGSLEDDADEAPTPRAVKASRATQRARRARKEKESKAAGKKRRAVVPSPVRAVAVADTLLLDAASPAADDSASVASGSSSDVLSDLGLVDTDLFAHMEMEAVELFKQSPDLDAPLDFAMAELLPLRSAWDSLAFDVAAWDPLALDCFQ